MLRSKAFDLNFSTEVFVFGTNDEFDKVVKICKSAGLKLPFWKTVNDVIKVNLSSFINKQTLQERS